MAQSLAVSEKVRRSKQSMGRAPARVSSGWHAWQRITILTIVGFLLGRASIEHTISPFGFAYFVILAEIVGRKRSWPAAAAIIGVFTTASFLGAMLMMSQFGVYLIVRQLIFRKRAPDLPYVPMAAGIIAALCKMAMVGTVWTKYDLMLSLAEGALVTLLCLIFIQCLPIFVGSEHKTALRHEQILSLIILGGTVVMGFQGLTLRGISLTDVAIDWIVLMLACGGMGISAACSIVVGMLALINHAVSMENVAILGFAGLLAGLLKETNRVMVGFTFLLSTSVLSFMTSTNMFNEFHYVLASIVAVILYLITPRRLHAEFASYVPGTREHKKSEQQHTQRVQSLLADKIGKFGEVFEELSATFADVGENQFTSAQQLVNHVVGASAKSVCHGCPRYGRCWDKEAVQTYQAMMDTVTNLEALPVGRGGPTPELKDRCCRVDAMVASLRYNMEITDRDAKWISKMQEQQKLVSAQLSGVASVVRSIAEEIEDDAQQSVSGETQILAALDQMGMYVDHVRIVCLDPGKVEIEITQPTKGAYENSARVIAPLLSGILGENITVTKVRDPSAAGPCVSVFASANCFQIKTSVATVAKDGRVVSGDTHTAMDLGNGRYAVAVSDGMGNGERARRESKAALDLLKRLLTAGFHEKLAIQTVNSTLLLRSQDEMFTTLDMALIDLFSAKAEFLKIGSAPSFVKRGRDVFTVSGANVPIGILQDIEVQAVEEQLREGDILILMSDGIYDAPHHVYDKEDWLREQITRIETANPQAIADTLLESVIRMNHGQIEDDMTVVVSVVEKFEPEWAAIRLPGIAGLRQNERGRRGA